jgi:hypothetical protein
MSLREALQLSVARCAPHAMQHATTGVAVATGHATDVQQEATSPRCADATTSATTVQPTSCTPVALAARGCASCRHRSRVGTCKEPVAAGLSPQFSICWPEPGYGTTCAAWKRNPADAIVAVLTAAGRNGWPDKLMHQWLEDANTWPEAVLDVLTVGKQRPTNG